MICYQAKKEKRFKGNALGDIQRRPNKVICSNFREKYVGKTKKDSLKRSSTRNNFKKNVKKSENKF